MYIYIWPCVATVLHGELATANTPRRITNDTEIGRQICSNLGQPMATKSGSRRKGICAPTAPCKYLAWSENYRNNFSRIFLKFVCVFAIRLVCQRPIGRKSSKQTQMAPPSDPQKICISCNQDFDMSNIFQLQGRNTIRPSPLPAKPCRLQKHAWLSAWLCFSV